MEENQNMNEEMMDSMEMDNAMDEKMTKTANANETKSEKFMRLAEYRVNRLMNDIASLEKLHNKSSYEYSNEQVEMMFGSIEAQLNQAKSLFSATTTKEVKFSFGSMK